MKKQYRKQSGVVFVIFLFIGITLTPVFNALPPSSISHQTYEKQISTSTMQMTIRQTLESLFLDVSIQSFESKEMTIDGRTFQQIRLPHESFLINEGKPELPTICRSILIPDDATMSVKVLASTIQEYPDMSLAPSKGNLFRDTDPNTVPYSFDEMYDKDEWFPEQIVSLGEPYVLRDFRGQAVTIVPFQYNPVKKTMRFFTDISIEVSSTGPSAINVLNRVAPPSTISSDFSILYRQRFINYGLTGFNPREDVGSMLIITFDEFWNELKPFAEWKAMRGIQTEIVNISTIGDALAVKNFISSYYQSNAVTYVLLVGDVQQVPTMYVNSDASDPSYSYIVGTDHDPDVFIGRFSAQTIDELRTQINRTIVYEKFPQVDGSWYQKGTGIGSNQGPGDDNEYDWQHIRNIRSDLLNYTYLSIDEFYDGSHGGGDASGDPTDTMVTTALNNGRGIINYCGHGSSTSWGTTYFNNNDINALINENMLPFIFSVACYNGAFTQGTCFAEAWLRAQHNGVPTGAIAAFMSSKSQAWNPPMEAQDEINDLLVTDIESTIGGLCVAGDIRMNDRYGTQGAAETDAWHVFGDPSLQVRTDAPLPMAVQHDSFLRYDSTSFDVTIKGEPRALCTILNGTTVFGAAYTNASEAAHIVFTKMLHYGQNVTLSVTGYNKIPYSASLNLTGTDAPPVQPGQLTGRKSVIVGINSTYTVTTTDPEGHQILYQFDFNDGNLSEWFGPYESGQPCSVVHQWKERGTYSVHVRAKDVYDFQSDWSDPLVVKIRNGFFIRLLLQLLEKISPQLYQMIIGLLQQ